MQRMQHRPTAADPADPVSYWLRGEPGPAHPPLAESTTADVVIVGAGFTGLWTALALTDTDPSLSVVVLEAASVGFGASGRNGGFCEASLTHGLANGIRHFPDELDRLEAEGPTTCGRSSRSRGSTPSTATSRRPARCPLRTMPSRSTSSGRGSM
jgi:2-polyprenyl-6-methoxyphenol hydroxylase-like FAD-dependent oxidoreductase